MHVIVKKEIGSTLKREGPWSLFKIKAAVEEFQDLIVKREKLQKRLIQVSGRDFDQEMAVMQRLESLDQLIEIIQLAVYGEGILTDREACIMDHRLDGETLKEIGEFLYVTSECVRRSLSKSYKKISNAAKAKYLE